MAYAKFTTQETEAILLVHHDHLGLTRKKAAENMKISQARLSEVLKSARLKAPQLFPILTHEQNNVRWAIMEMGQDRQTCAIWWNWSIKKVDNIIAQLRSKGISLTVPKTVRYEPHMDGQVRKRF